MKFLVIKTIGFIDKTKVWPAFYMETSEKRWILFNAKPSKILPPPEELAQHFTGQANIHQVFRGSTFDPNTEIG